MFVCVHIHIYTHMNKRKKNVMERKLDWKLQIKNLRLGEVKANCQDCNFLGTKLVFESQHFMVALKEEKSNSPF